MHYNETHRFDTETEAQTFADGYLVNGRLPVDTYVTGPLFTDEKITYRGLPVCKSYEFKKYWTVTVEKYT